LVIDLAELVPKAEWPLPPSGPQRVVLEYGGQARVLSPGRIDTAEGWYYRFRKPLAADSQPFEISAEMRVGWTELPWGAMATWATALAAVMAAAHAWWRQRTERRRAQELLRLGQVGRLNALGELAAGMAHELNQPLTAVLASVDAAGRMLAEEQPDVEAARGAIGLASAQARRAAEVTGRLRRVVERPELAAHMQQVRLDDAARNALELLAPDCARLGVAPTLAVDASARTALADPVALEQITHNLLSNALHALEQVPAGERRLELSVAPDGPRSVLSVRDSGPGIAPEMLAHLFEPFFSSRPGGLGLGLSLCETLALGMGGALTGTNVAPHGAEFRLTLPRAPAPAA
jgi:C4-dicarboxylate-specific signal transduction histidine kinase